jgi:hypothetical protein
MRLAHKRRVLQKLKKIQVTGEKRNVATKQPKASDKKEEKQAVKVESPSIVDAPALTPKQQQVLDIISQHADAISPKDVGLKAGQEDAKAAAWATGGIKKLVELNLVEKLALAGNKVA